MRFIKVSSSGTQIVVGSKVFNLPVAAPNRLTVSFSDVLLYIVLLLVVFVTFHFQNRIVGFEPGYNELEPGHHGWVSSHTLAIISRASPENYFVGYAEAFVDDDLKKEFEYFDRYPVFFSALFHSVLSLYNNLSAKVYLAKQVMNLIFLSTLFVAFLIVNQFADNKLLALTTTLFAFSNQYLLFYKDMVHFDQPALFGFLLLILSIAFYKFHGKKFLVYIATLIAIGSGRGYASYAILVLWVLIESFLIIKSKDLKLADRLKIIIKHDSIPILILAIFWGASLLSYNIIVETNKRGVPISQTSIFDSASRRLSFDEEFNEDYSVVLNWENFIENQFDRIVRWSFPINFYKLSNWTNISILLFMSIPMGIFISKQATDKRIVLLILVLSGFAWLFPMRNLSAFHDYTTMFYIGVPLVFFLSIFSFLKPSRETAHYLLVASMVVFTAAILNIRELHKEREGPVSKYTYDFMEINKMIEGEGKYIHLTDNVPRAPYAPGFFLADHYISSMDLADYVISADKNFLPNNLTPDNKKMFLFSQ